MLFAQAAPAAGGPPPNLILGILAGVCGFYLLAFLVFVVVGVLFLRTLGRTLDRCAPDLRLMDPGQVWLNLIPFFNVVWLFVTAIRVSDSLRLEFADRRLDEDDPGGTYGKTLGLSALVLLLVSCGSCCVPVPLAANGGPELALATGLARLVGLVAVLVVFLLYWVRVAGYGRQLADDDARGEPEEADEDRRRGAADRGPDPNPDGPAPPLPPSV